MDIEKQKTQKDIDPNSNAAFEPGKDEFAIRKQSEMERRLAGKAMEVASGLITMPDSIQESMLEQASREAALKPAPQPLIEMPEHLVPEGPKPSFAAEVQPIAEVYLPGPQAIRRNAVEVAPGHFVMPQDLDDYYKSKNNSNE